MSAPASRPNVILIMSDQHRADAMGCAGNPIVRTPALDRLAREGVLFESSFTQCPVCMASRAAIHTGRYPRTVRVPSMGLVSPTEVTLAETFQRAGYATGLFGKLHFNHEMYSLLTLKRDRPVDDAEPFLEMAGIDTTPYRAASRDPFKKNYGFQTSFGVDDNLWGHYLDWLVSAGPEHIPHHVSENWGAERDGVKFASSPPARRMFPDRVSDFFDSRVPAELHPSTFIMRRTLEFIKEHKDRPFFAHCSFVDPHHPFNAPIPYSRMYPPAQMPVPPTFNREACFPPDLPQGVARQIERGASHPDQLWQWCLANYYGMISNIDSCIERLLATLSELGLRENTIIVYTSDHGEYAGDHRLLYKGSLVFDGIMRIPLIFSWKDHLNAGRRVADLVQEIDIYPTLMRLVGLPVHAGVQGKDLSEALVAQEPGQVGYESVFCELDTLENKTFVPCQVVRTREWKLEYFPHQHTGMLYDLVSDPGELRNRYSDPACAAIRERMFHLLLDRMYDIRDPQPISLGQA